MLALLILVPVALLGLCAVAACVAGGRADSMMEAQRNPQVVVHTLKARPEDLEPNAAHRLASA
jgi:hypothetical protein